jgi:hypothetical protein
MASDTRGETVSLTAAQPSAPLDPHDVSLIEQRLRLSPDERIADLVAAVAFIAELRAEMAKARAGAA